MSYTMRDGWKWIKLWNHPSRWAHSCRRARLDPGCWQPCKSVRLLPSHPAFTGLPAQPACAQHSPAKSPGPSTHKTSHTPDTGPAPHMQSLDQDLLPQERWNRQSLSHGRWKREGDLRRSEEPQEPGLNKWQHSSPQLLSTQFKCSAKQWQLQLPAGVRYRIHIHFLHLLLKSRTRFKSNLRNYLNEANDQEILSHQEQN